MCKRIEPTLEEPSAEERIPLAQRYESAAERYSSRGNCKAAGGKPAEAPPAEEPAPVPVEQPASYGAKWPQLKNILLPDDDDEPPVER
ncbi:hypothetical protein SAMN05216577_111156 [Pseudomonas citronellolis]|uniref:Uncharacterized protein n=1 Tax=Pseudomonas citronellolis TaxID=53408 RepID=A0AAQ1HMP5_9PSED|nr:MULTISPECIES: hypothetical protein [Pseudomonas]MBG4910267.1 hypothetical protein [Pseudomonas aeruginosa]KWR75254.1 hypothetical protein RN02_23625 [Pseudomonas sp. PI1]TGC30872.1 hypothetical protein CW310_07545 [Pseudomonas citronellolis]UUC52320.1 hypothetical protein NOX82_10525 [Pseudomonas citronellolis]SFC86013.1 hypothetical protein SAMN05216577_111156 [Pseudomonas citronellolis]